MQIKTIVIASLVLLGFNTVKSQNAIKEDAAKLFAENNNLKNITVDSAKAWKTGGVVTLAASQVSLTNWAAGGQSSVSANGLLSLFANYKKGENTWSNNLDLAYGVIRQGENKNWWKND
ncbi:MAG TPA: DUF3078 domain-containing protein, partial [Bacteroidia bacterium]